MTKISTAEAVGSSDTGNARGCEDAQRVKRRAERQGHVGHQSRCVRNAGPPQTFSGRVAVSFAFTKLLRQKGAAERGLQAQTARVQSLAEMPVCSGRPKGCTMSGGSDTAGSFWVTQRFKEGASSWQGGSHAGSGTPRLLGTWDTVWHGAGGRAESPWGREAGCSMNPVACPTAAHLAWEKVGHAATPAARAAGTQPGDVPGSSPVTPGQWCPTGLSGWWKHLKSVLLVQWPLPAGDTELSFRLD